jgi:hypothetical protein
VGARFGFFVLRRPSARLAGTTSILPPAGEVIHRLARYFVGDTKTFPVRRALAATGAAARLPWHPEIAK